MHKLVYIYIAYAHSLVMSVIMNALLQPKSCHPAQTPAAFTNPPPSPALTPALTPPPFTPPSPLASSPPWLYL